MDDITSKVYEVAEELGGEFKENNKGEYIAKYCPFCHGGRNHEDKYTFAIGLHNGAYNCKRGSCEAKGSIYDLCRFAGVPAPTRQNYTSSKVLGSAQKAYDRPDEKSYSEPTEEILNYFAMRKISADTIKAWHIKSDSKGNIVFPFYRDGKLIYVKFREPRKHTKDSKLPKEWQMSNTEAILFGMDMTVKTKPLVIVEGEIDALSMYEAGVENVVSVPQGAKAFEWVALCWDFLEQFQQIILFGDYDEPGTQMVSTLIKRLGEERCLIPDEYPELVINGEPRGRVCKDANEILYCYGPEKLKELVDQCAAAPVHGILDVAAVPYIDPTTVPRIFTKIPELDDAIGGFGEGGISIISGRRAEGKSTITGQFMLQAIEQGHNVCIYSGELSAQKVFEWLCSQAVEDKYVTTKIDPRNGKVYTYVPIEIQERVRQWMIGHCFLYDNSWSIEGEQTENILKIFSISAKRYGCTLFLCDNLMSALCSPDEENKAQARFVAKLKAFAVRYSVHVIIVAHTRKEKAGVVMTNDSVSGSSAITNLADIVLNIEKPDVRILKNREFGETPYIKCRYNPVNRRIFQENIGDRTVYSWDHTGIKEPTIQAMKLPQFQIKPREEEMPEGILKNQVPF